MFNRIDSEQSGVSVIIVSYNPEWKSWFTEIQVPIWEKLSEYLVEIVHVGSTSVEGMSAKPVIDIDAVVDSWDNLPEILKLLDELGYKHRGNLGIKEREAFNIAFEPKYPHNFYVCHKDSIAYKNHILLKKHLSENPEDFARYETLKIGLGNTESDIDTYTKLKTDLILEFLAVEGMPEEEINEIRSENLA